MPEYANCTPDVLDLCVRAVASEMDLADAFPHFSAHEVALVARDALEAVVTLERRPVTAPADASDWALATYARVCRDAGIVLRRQRLQARADVAFAEGNAALIRVAASPYRSPVLWYGPIYYNAATVLARGRNRLALVRQAEAVAEAIAEGYETNIVSAVRDLANMHLRLGDYGRGLSMWAALIRSDASDPWVYNAVALEFPGAGLPSLARLAAARGIDLLDRGNDERELRSQLEELLGKAGAGRDSADAPTDAVAEVRDALNTDFDSPVKVPAVDLAYQLAPEAKTARVKQLPPLLAAHELRELAAGIRARFGGSSREPTGPTIARNAHCPCGSGKKYKKCHGQNATPP
jgi:hypothetical protein